MSSLTNWSAGSSTIPFSRRTGLGINRQTWNAARNYVGRPLKRGYDWMQGRQRRQAKLAKRRVPAKRTQGTQTGVQIPIAGGDSKSYYSRKNPRKGDFKNTPLELTPSIVTNNNAFRIECGVGVQESTNLMATYTVADTNLAFTLATGGSPPSAKIFFKQCHTESMITNQSNINARIYLYDVFARRNSSDVNLSASGVFQLGFADNTSGAAADYTVVGTTPFGNPRFTQYFRINKVTDITLSPGATHTHIVHIAPNKIMSGIDFTGADGDFVGDWTHYTLMVFHGTPLNDLTTQTQVSTGAVALDVVQKEQFTHTYTHASGGAADVNNTLVTAFTNAGSTMQDDGAEIPWNEA